MGKYDTAILELLDKTELALPPKVIAFNLEYLGVASPATSTVQRRLGILAQNRFVEKVDEKSGYYTVSDRGGAYLHDDVGIDPKQVKHNVLRSNDKND